MKRRRKLSRDGRDGDCDDPTAAAATAGEFTTPAGEGVHFDFIQDDLHVRVFVGSHFSVKTKTNKQTSTHLGMALSAPSSLVFSTRLQLKAVLTGVTLDHPVGYF